MTFIANEIWQFLMWSAYTAYTVYDRTWKMNKIFTTNYFFFFVACECVVFQSLGGTEGRFHSPNFPQYYSKGIECILFTFIGDLGELIEIKFTEFDMLHPSYDSL